MNEILFRRYAGAGNSFVVIDAVAQALPVAAERMEAFVQSACKATATDGLILIAPSERAPFAMNFYNPDGSYGALCGNGARCAVQAATDFGVSSGTTPTFEVLGNVDDAEILADELVRVHFQDPTAMKFNFSLRVAQRLFIKANYVDLGSQHVVAFLDEANELTGAATIEDMQINNAGPRLRWHPDFAPTFANANFASIEEDGEGKYIRIRTFERGVEGETLACGTGCMSTAIAAFGTGRIQEFPMRLKTQSGEFVKVNFNTAERKVTGLTLEGSAKRGPNGILTFDETNGKVDLRWQ